MIDAGIKFPTRGDYTNYNVIENVLLYMFQIPTDSYPDRKPVPIHFYGIPYIGYPPKAEDVITQFEAIRKRQRCIIPQQIWHMELSFPIVFEDLTSPYFYFADEIARLFCWRYPVCYAYHDKNRETKNRHSHFHFGISTSSYIADYPPLDATRFQSYLAQIPAIAQAYGVHLYHFQTKEELKCLNLSTIF